MPQKPVPEKEIKETVKAFREHGSKSAAAEALGIDRATVRRHLVKAEEMGLHFSEVSTPELPPEVADIENLKERQRSNWARKDDAETARKLIPIHIRKDGPIGIALMGDWHIDDPGCNFPLLERDLGIIKNTDGLYAGLVGDLENAWIGRLAYKWAHQNVTARESYELVKWGVSQIAEKLIFITYGNHDLWTVGNSGIHALDFMRTTGVKQAHAARIKACLPSGVEIRINARHDFRGRSQWNPAHGPAKAAWFGWRDDILVAGHIHQSGYIPLRDPMTGGMNHAIRPTSYKHYDSYAQKADFFNMNMFECPVALVYPDKEDARFRVQIMFDLEEAAFHLAKRREEWEAKRN